MHFIALLRLIEDTKKKDIKGVTIDNPLQPDYKKLFKRNNGNSININLVAVNFKNILTE